MFTVGQEAKFIAEGARRSGFDAFKIFEFSDVIEAGETRKKNNPRRGLDFGQRLPTVPEWKKWWSALLPIRKTRKNFLVRQEEEWKNR